LQTSPAADHIGTAERPPAAALAKADAAEFRNDSAPELHDREALCNGVHLAHQTFENLALAYTQTNP